MNASLKTKVAAGVASLCLLVVGTSQAQSLKIDFGTGNLQEGYHIISDNNAVVYTNSFGAGLDATVSLSADRWKVATAIVSGPNTDLSNLLYDFGGPLEGGTSVLSLTLPAGIFDVKVYHHESNRSVSKLATVTVTYSHGVQPAKDVECSFGSNPANDLESYSVQVESNGEDPVTLSYENKSNGIFPINGVDITMSTTPATRQGSFTYGGETFNYDVTKFSTRGPDFEVSMHRARNALGGDKFKRYIPDLNIRTYMGRVLGHPKAMVVGYLRSDNTFYGEMFLERYARRIEFDTGVGGKDTSVQIRPFNIPERSPLLAKTIKSGVYRFMLGIDVPYAEFVESAGSDMDTLVEMLDVAAAKVAAIYVRDAKLVPAVNHIVVRTNQAVDPYKKGGTRAIMATEWQEVNSNLSTVDYDKLILIGISTATVGGTTAGGDVKGNVWRHEVGHTFGPSNDQGGSPEGATIMVRFQHQSRFSSTELYSIIAYRNDNIGWLDYSKTFDIPTPPYGNYDFKRVTRGDAPLSIDVLANDHDANDDALAITNFSDHTSFLGAAVSLSKGTGPEGRDELIYTAPDHMVGTDHFFYTVTDGTGFAFEAVVVIEIAPPHTIWEAEKADTSGIKMTNRPSATGGSYIRLLKKADQYVEWKANIPKDGWYGFKIRFGQAQEADTSFSLSLNKTNILNLVTPMTGKNREWENFVYPRIYLESGTNTIRFTTSSEVVKTEVDHLMIHEANDIRINFTQPATVADPSQGWIGNYCQDGGASYGDRGYGDDLKYGWATTIPTNDILNRNLNDVPREDLASSILLQNGTTNKTWEIDLPNGEYHVYVMCGDGGVPSKKVLGATNHVDNIWVENKKFVDPDGIDYFDAYQDVVRVEDGKLTIKPAPGAVNAKICFIWICDNNTAPIVNTQEKAPELNQGGKTTFNLWKKTSDNEVRDSDLTYRLPSTTSKLGNPIKIVDGHIVKFTRNIAGNDRFNYIVTDPQLLSATGTISVVINNGTPVVNNTAPDILRDGDIKTPGGTLGKTDLWDLVTDAETKDSKLTFALAPEISEQGHTISLKKHRWGRITPPESFFGQDSFTYTVKDAGGLISTGTVNVIVLAADFTNGLISNWEGEWEREGEVEKTSLAYEGLILDEDTIPLELQSSNDINLNPFTNRTWSLWFKADAVINRQVLYEQGDESRGVNMYLNDDQLVCGIWGMTGENKRAFIRSSDISAGKWYHVALVLDGDNGTVTTYLDGIPNDRVVEGSSLEAQADEIGLGSVHGTTKFAKGMTPLLDNYKGSIKHLRVYNTALDTNEVERIYEASKEK